MQLTDLSGGKPVAAATPFESLNPSKTDEIVATYPAGGAAEVDAAVDAATAAFPAWSQASPELRSEEHTSELQSLMRISYAVFCLKKKKQKNKKAIQLVYKTRSKQRPYELVHYTKTYPLIV